MGEEQAKVAVELLAVVPCQLSADGVEGDVQGAAVSLKVGRAGRQAIRGRGATGRQLEEEEARDLTQGAPWNAWGEQGSDVDEAGEMGSGKRREAGCGKIEDGCFQRG